MVLSGTILQEIVTHLKAFTRKNLIKEIFIKMLSGLKGFTRNGGHQGSSKDGKPLLSVSEAQ